MVSIKTIIKLRFSVAIWFDKFHSKDHRYVANEDNWFDI